MSSSEAPAAAEAQAAASYTNHQPPPPPLTPAVGNNSLLSSATENETDAATNLFNLVAPTGAAPPKPPPVAATAETTATATTTTTITDATAAAAADASPSVAAVPANTTATATATTTGAATTTTTQAASKPITSTRGRKKSRGLYPSFPLMLYKLMAFRCQYNHCRVTTEDDHALGSWVALVRRCYSEHKRGQTSNYLTQERIDILNSIGFTWSLLQCSNDKRWESNFKKLLEFRERHGHCNAPQSTPLGKWVQMQRDQYRELQIRKSGEDSRTRTRPMITQDRLERLNEVGFQWRVADRAVGWEARYEELAEFKRIHGNCNVPQGYKPNVPLGRWVMKQRVQYHKLQRGQKSQMKEDRIQKLEALGFQWVGPGAQRTGKKRKFSDRDEDDDDVEEDDEHEHVETLNQHQQHQPQHLQPQQQLLHLHHHHHPNQQPPYPPPPPAHYPTYQQQQPPQLQPQQPPAQHAYAQQPAQELEAPSPYYQTNWL